MATRSTGGDRAGLSAITGQRTGGAGRWRAGAPVLLTAAVAMLAAGAAGTQAAGGVTGSLDAWRPTGAMATTRSNQTAALLRSGMVLVAGGCCSIASAELYNPHNGTWSATGSLHQGRVRLRSPCSRPDGSSLRVHPDWGAVSHRARVPR